jgi:uncharacterized membrane protein HdeD (DUF308 family)
MKFKHPGSNEDSTWMTYTFDMSTFGKVSRWRKFLGWPFLASGVFNILGIVFNANGASLGVGILNTIIGVLFLSPGVKAE